MVSKINSIISALNTSLYYVIAFTETWLSPAVCNSELHFNNYIIFIHVIDLNFIVNAPMVVVY